ncbi:hypothetical protein ACSBLW_12685 [Thioclava sp. FR2]|uniref:hypothetical protein n=1 Tax=Thioclava sp. FR2 TaxID=3445780 RepID=UPI003EB7A216
MRRLILSFAVVLALVLPALAQDDPFPDPLVVLDEAFALWSAEDLAGYREYMSAAIRRARQEDSLSADWAFIFGTYADFVRNEDKNSPLALRLAEEGLAYLAPHGAENADLLALLQVSRVYALADLGRFDEAVTAARLAEPLFRQSMGDEMADDLLETVKAWDKGETTIFNNAPAELARAELKKADEALDRGEYGVAMTIAARASLPEGSGIDAAEVARVNAAAAAKTGRALYWLGRREEAFALLRRAALWIAAEGWEEAPDAALKVEPMGEAQAVTEMFFWLARAGLDTENFWIVPPALQMAERLDDGTLGLLPISYARATLYDALYDGAAAEAEFARAVTVAETGGKTEEILMSRYYLALRRYANTGADREAKALIALTREMAQKGSNTTFYDPVHVQSETAVVLLESPYSQEALEFARAALKAKLAGIFASTDTKIGQDGQRAQTRRLVETLLQTAHLQDSRKPTADCSRPADQGFGCAIFYDR